MDDAWRNEIDGRLGQVEKRLGQVEKRLGSIEMDVHAIKEPLGWTKLVPTVFIGTSALVMTVLVILTTLVLNISSKVDALPGVIASEFRSQRAESSAQTSAIANAIIAVKQQAPQVILVPAPTAALPKTP